MFIIIIQVRDKLLVFLVIIIIIIITIITIITNNINATTTHTTAIATASIGTASSNDKGIPGFRVCYAAAESDKIVQAIKLLGDVLQKLHN